MTAPDDSESEAPQRLFAAGPFGPGVDDYRKRVAGLLRDAFVPRMDAAERAGQYPREALADLGASGLFRERWPSRPYGDPGIGIVIAEEGGRLGNASMSAGLSVHCETIISILIRYGDTPLLRDYLDGVLDGRLVGCIGASEATVGSDLSGVHTVARKLDHGWHITGEKKYVSLAAVCDFALVLCRLDEGAGAAVGRLGLFAVPASGLTLKMRLNKVGTAALDTSWVVLDAEVPDQALVGRTGLGLIAMSWGLNHERLSVAAQTVGGVDKALGLVTAHLHRRRQFGTPLIEHQALRIRLGDLSARLLVLRYAVYTAAQAIAGGTAGTREIAALKVTAARFAEEASSECMHMFGGAGYLEDQTPLARMWRDSRLARIGAGTDEMMWELVANGLVPDFDAYEENVKLG